MKKLCLLIMSLLICLALFAGCKEENSQATSTDEEIKNESSELSSDEKESEEAPAFPTDEEIIEALSAELTDADFQDPSLFPSMNDFLGANFGLSTADVSDAIYYTGAPKQNTTFFAILTKAENADAEAIIQKLDNVMKAQITTAEQGYISGYTEYDIIEKENKIFVVMNKDSDGYTAMKKYINKL